MVGEETYTSAIFLTFSGNCKKALTFYQSCFGGKLQFDLFEQQLPGFTEMPVIRGSLVSEKLIIHASDLVHNEGRRVGNNIALFLPCKDAEDRLALVNKLTLNRSLIDQDDLYLPLLEVIDAYEVRWMLAI